MPRAEITALRHRNEDRCRRILAASSPLVASDVTGPDVADTEVEPDVLDVLVYMRDVEGFTDRDLVGLTAHRTTLGDPVIAAFLEVWRREEAGHAAAIGAFLDSYGQGRGVAVPPRQLPPPAVANRRERLVARTGGPVGSVVAAAHMAWGAANELLTLNGYRILARRCGHPQLAELLTRIAAQEARHYSFYLLQAEWRLAASPAARTLLPLVLRKAWTPVGIGDGYKGSDEFDRVVKYLASGPEGEVLVRRMDNRFSALPGFDGLRIYREAMRTPAAA